MSKQTICILDTSLLCVWLQVAGKETCGSPPNNYWDYTKAAACSEPPFYRRCFYQTSRQFLRAIIVSCRNTDWRQRATRLSAITTDHTTAPKTTVKNPTHLYF